MAQSLNSLAVGALVKDTGTLYNGKPIIWKIADKGHTGYPSGAVTLITERIISLKCFDAIESGNSDGDRRSYGNNRWTLSNLRQWLNSQAAAGKWYSAQHGADAAPTNANVWSTYNEYDAEAGFLAGFSANFIAALLTTTHTVGKATVDGGGTESCADKIFLATCTEVGLSGDVTAGSKLALFSNDSSRLAYTFTKNETEIELMLATPLAADDMVTKGIMSVVRQIPAGAKFTVEVCNNGFDTSPTWEDVTQNIVSGSKFFLSNTTKTANAWGYNFRIKVKRGTATGDCFITSAGGNFE